MVGLGQRPAQQQKQQPKATPSRSDGMAAGAPKQGAQGSRGSEDEGSNVSPEEQKQYDQFVKNGMRLMYSEQGTQAIVQSLAGDGDPVAGLANTVAMVVLRLKESAEKKGAQLSTDVVMHGGLELLEQAADFASQAGIHEYSPEEMESATWKAEDIVRSTLQQQGKLPVDEIGQELEQLMAADQSGQIDQVLPGVSGFAQRSQQGGPTPQQQPQRRGLGM